jgi:hypothetical protein
VDECEHVEEFEGRTCVEHLQVPGLAARCGVAEVAEGRTEPLPALDREGPESVQGLVEQGVHGGPATVLVAEHLGEPGVDPSARLVEGLGSGDDTWFGGS